MKNLLAETREAIAKSGHTEADIVFVGLRNAMCECTWDEFCVLANREYDNDFGSVEVSRDLVVVFSDGQTMWRGEHAGREWWEYSKPFDPRRSDIPRKPLDAESLFVEPALVK